MTEIVTIHGRKTTWTRYCVDDEVCGYRIVKVNYGKNSAGSTSYDVVHVGTEDDPGCLGRSVLQHRNISSRIAKNHRYCPNCASNARSGFLGTGPRRSAKIWRQNLPDPASLPPQWPKPPSIPFGKHYHGR